MIVFVLSNENGKFKMNIWIISRPRVEDLARPTICGPLI